MKKLKKIKAYLLKLKKGFTLLEILLVVGIIAILAGIVIIAINPSKTLATVRNAERRSDLKQIDSALSQHYIDYARYPTSTESGLQEICNTGSIPYPHIGIDCTGYLDLSILVPTYITAIPRDALASTSSSTGYIVYKHSSSRKIQLIASNAELGVVIAIGTTTGMTISDIVTPPVECTTAASGFYAGDGVGAPYQICSWTQLNNVRNDLAANYILNNNLTSSDTDYLGIGSNWTPIGNCEPTYCVYYGGDVIFSGNFNGNGKTISDLNINLPSSRGVGLFGYSSGNIENIGLINVSVIGYSDVGGLVGFNQGIVNNSYTSGNVNENGGSTAGGLVGTQYASTAQIINSHSNVSVTGSIGLLGGLVGLQTGGTIYNSYAAGPVSGGSYVGGLVGGHLIFANGLYSGGWIYNSYATGNVTGNTYAGGLIGWHDSGIIENSYSIGNVIGNSDVGGLAGTRGSGTITNSYWDVDTSEIGISGDNNYGAIGKTIDEMKKLYTFNSNGGNWDISGGQPDLNNNYPYLSGTTPVWYIADNTATSP